MHNNSFQLYSHQQVGRLSPVFFRVFSSSCAYFMQLLSGNQVHIPLPQMAVDRAVAVAPVLSLILVKEQSQSVMLCSS